MLCQEAEFCDTAPMLATAFTELVGCQVPIQQAAMGGASTPQLAIAVSRAGGLGMLEHASLIPLADRVAAVEQAHAGPFGVNFLMPFLDRSKLDDVELAAGRARLVEFFYDTPDPGLISLVHAGGALAGWQVGSVAEAMQAVDAGCDLIIAQGVEAGGHVRGALGLIPLLADVLEVVTVPVLAAGGISTARGMAAALAAGAAGVRVGTRFVATEESGAHLRCRAAGGSRRSDDSGGGVLGWLARRAAPCALFGGGRRRGASGRDGRDVGNRERVAANPAVVRRNTQPRGDRPRRGHGAVRGAGSRPGHPGGTSRPGCDGVG